MFHFKSSKCDGYTWELHNNVYGNHVEKDDNKTIENVPFRLLQIKSGK